MVRVSQNCYLVQSGTRFTNSALCLTACWPELSASRAPPSEEIVNALFQRLVVCGALVQLKLLNVHVLMCHPSGYMPLLSPPLPSPPLPHLFQDKLNLPPDQVAGLNLKSRDQKWQLILAQVLNRLRCHMHALSVGGARAMVVKGYSR